MSFKCLCGNEYTLVPDEETVGMPPSFTARQFHCKICGAYDWLEAYDLELEDWPENLTG
jgi:hypothetical protein